VDYIGNHRCFLQAAMALLFETGESRGALSMALKRIADGTLELPPGCAVHYELEALDILRGLARPPRGAEALALWYRAFEEEHDVRPTASEAWHAGFAPRTARRAFGSWLGLVTSQQGLGTAEAQAFTANRTFFEALEKTPMTKSYKMLVLLAMIASERFPGTISIEELIVAIRHQARRSLYLEQDVGDALADDANLRQLLERNPIAAWVGGQGMDGAQYFDYEDGAFRTRLDSDGVDGSALAALTREICEWRLAEYVAHAHGEHRFAPIIRCKVSHSNGRPILFLPDRDTQPGIPFDWVEISVDGVPFSAKFAKIAVNVVEAKDAVRNRLPEMLRSWFGADAGAPGGADYVLFRRQDNGYVMEPVEDGNDGSILWREYQRSEIPLLFGLTFGQSRWNQGFVHVGDHMFLLVSLEKGDLGSEHQYADQFVSSTEFQWQSQNQHSRDGKVGQRIREHQARAIAVHLFVRRQRKTPDGKAAPFTYCGEVDFQEWSGDLPITIRWRLRTPLPNYVAMRFGLK